MPRPPVVLFLCTGNYYRSRFAEYYFNRLAAQGGTPWCAISRGLALSDANVGPVSQHALEALQRRGIELPRPHRAPMAVSRADLQAAAHIVAVKEAEHRPLLAAHFPEWVPRVEFWQIHDLDCATPCQALPLLEAAVQELASRLCGVGPRHAAAAAQSMRAVEHHFPPPGRSS